MTQVEKLEQTLRSAGYSSTKSRKHVFETLEAKGLLSISELTAECPRVDRASIYRILELFEKLHIITKIPHGFKYKVELSDSFASHHHHIRCQRCGRDQRLENEALESYIKTLFVSLDFEPTSHVIELSGICSACRR